MQRDPLTIESLLALGALESLPRTGWVLRGVRTPETIGEHMLGVQWLCLALAQPCGIDAERAIALALVHDAPEALLGDWPRSAAELLPQGAKRHAEAQAAAQVLAPLGQRARASCGTNGKRKPALPHASSRSATNSNSACACCATHAKVARAWMSSWSPCAASTRAGSRRWSTCAAILCASSKPSVRCAPDES